MKCSSGTIHRARTLHIFTELVIFITFERFFDVHFYVCVDNIIFFGFFYETNGQTHTYVKSIIRFILNFFLDFFHTCTACLFTWDYREMAQEVNYRCRDLPSYVLFTLFDHFMFIIITIEIIFHLSTKWFFYFLFHISLISFISFHITI